MIENQPLPELRRITIGRQEDNQVILAPTDIGGHAPFPVMVTPINKP